jgi:two-component system cell cycle response regulator
VYVDGDRRLAEHAFLLFISEHSAYALLSGPGGRTFHTSDAPLVDALVSKLQALYDLQPL